MGQKKKIRFEAIGKFPNVHQYPENMAGRWSQHFQNDHPIILELACGKGEYSLGLGRENPQQNYIGVDIKGNRIYHGARRALEEGLKNVAFLRAPITRLATYFAPQEFKEIWIIFPDPFLRESRAKNRLTHPRFLRIYQQLLPPDARIHLKTDSAALFAYTLETLEEQGAIVHESIDDLYGLGKAVGPLAIQTFYEKMHLEDGRTIRYVSFSLPKTPIQVEPRFLHPEPPIPQKKAAHE